jgi:transcriptional regulator with XRE-family HTH domain
MDMSMIGSRIRDERKKHSLTLAELSERADISSNFLGNIERGVDTPSVETLLKIANALFVGVDTFVKDSLEIEHTADSQPDYGSMEIAREVRAMTKTQKECVLSCIKALKEFNT